MKRQKKISTVLYSIVLGVLILVGSYLEIDVDILKSHLMTMVSEAAQDFESDSSNEEEQVLAGSNLEVHFLDVGQALSVYISDDNGNDLLYDTGNEGDADFIIEYLKNKGVDDIEYLINSHPHEDHLGGMDRILEVYDVETVIMSNKTYDSKAYTDVIDAITEQNIASTDPVVGERYIFGNAVIEIMGPLNTSYEDTNNYSVIIKVINGNQSILLMGDAESLAEHELINDNTDLSADVLQVGHHGSDSSTTVQFLYEIDPEVAVISCGEDNKYGHPNSTVINRLENMEIDTHRTDIDGTVVIEMDGNDGVVVK